LPNSSTRSRRASARCPEHGIARQRAQLARDFERTRGDQRGVAQLVDQAHAQGRRGIEQRAARQQLRGMPADQPPEGAVIGPPGSSPHLHLVEAEAKVSLRHDAVVAVDGQHRAASRRMPGEPEHHGHRRGCDGMLRAPQLDEHRGDAVAIELQHRAHVESRREQAGLAGDHDGIAAGRRP
jgi:hypothetical protein